MSCPTAEMLHRARVGDAYREMESAAEALHAHQSTANLALELRSLMGRVAIWMEPQQSEQRVTSEATYRPCGRACIDLGSNGAEGYCGLREHHSGACSPIIPLASMAFRAGPLYPVTLVAPGPERCCAVWTQQSTAGEFQRTCARERGHAGPCG